MFVGMTATATTPRPEHGLFGPDSVTWRVNREAVLLAGGGRALLLQVAHPGVAAGVAQHSDYQEDPWGRLIRTLDVTTRMVFGDMQAAARAARDLHGAHASVHGETADGTPYSARDPDLLLWVWATLVDSALLVYGRYLRPLPIGDVHRYYEEQKRFAAACGVPDGHWPETYPDFTAYFQEMVAGELRVTPDARAVADAIMRPRVPWPLRPLFAPNTLITIGLLPAELRRQYGYDWGPGRERLLAASTVAVRGVLPLLPKVAREFPAARAATRRPRVASVR